MTNEEHKKEYVNRMNFVCGGKRYYFTVREKLHRTNHNKDIYIGCFCRDEGSAFENESLPAGLEYDKPYCLKEATICLPIHAQDELKECQPWDFFPFEGQNLRQILALNDDARRMSGMLMDGAVKLFGEEEALPFCCAAIEPLYIPFSVDKFPTAADKLDCMLQIVAAVKQLLQMVTLPNHTIIAHRNLHFDNVMLEEKEEGGYRVRLIDLSSVTVHNTNEDTDAAYDNLGLAAVENVTPEDVLPGQSINKKTDVFALGMMLAEIFRIWDFADVAEKNPLALLYSLERNVDFSNQRKASSYYQGKLNDYPYTNADVEGWLETVLDKIHGKKADWSSVERVCLDVRNLFRWATAIKPMHRVTLLRFEKELKGILSNLLKELSKPTVLADREEEKSMGKTVYFLVDTTQKDAYADIYIAAMQNVLQSMGNDTRVAIFAYGSAHVSETLHPDSNVFTVMWINAEDVEGCVRKIPQTHRGKMGGSAVKVCLHSVLTQLKSVENRRTFIGEIHIFAPDAPGESNSNRFSCMQQENGVTTEARYTGGGLFSTFGMAGDKVYVHTFDDDGATSREDWYTYCPLPKARPVALQTSQRGTVKVKPSSARQLRKPGGFCLLGGIKRERNF